MKNPVVRLVERFYWELWNRFDRSLVPVLLTADVEFLGSLGRSTRGHAEFWEYVEFIRRAFPDFQNEIQDVVSESDRAFARVAYSGTHQGEVFGIAPTGRKVTYSGAALFQTRGGRIGSIWVLGDRYGLIEQLHATQ